MAPLLFPEPGETLASLARRVMDAIPAQARPWVQVDTGGTRVALDVPDMPPFSGVDSDGAGTAEQEALAEHLGGETALRAPKEAKAHPDAPIETSVDTSAPTAPGQAALSAPRSPSARRAQRRRPPKETA